MAMKWETSKTANFDTIRENLSKIINKAKLNPRFSIRYHEQQVTLRFEDYAVITESLQLKFEIVQKHLNALGAATRCKIGFEGTNPGFLIHIKALRTKDLVYIREFQPSEL
jgi:hypothetical protein